PEGTRAKERKREVANGIGRTILGERLSARLCDLADGANPTRYQAFFASSRGCPLGGALSRSQFRWPNATSRESPSHHDVGFVEAEAGVETPGRFVVDGDHEAEAAEAELPGVGLCVRHQQLPDALAAVCSDHTHVVDPRLALPGDQVTVLTEPEEANPLS